MSERRACTTIGCCRMSVRYEATRLDNVALRERTKVIAHERRRADQAVEVSHHTIHSWIGGFAHRRQAGRF